MKTHYKKSFKLIVLPVILSIFMLSGLFMQAQHPPQSREVIEGYIGWAGNPDSLGVYIDTTWSEAEKDSVRAGIARWNDAGCEPKFKEVSNSADAEVTVKKGNPGKGNAGLIEWNEDADGKVTDATITIASSTSPLSIKEVVTHELGHAIGMDDVDHVANAGDVMKGEGPTNGTDGNLSQHDSTEMRQAASSITAIGDDPPVHEEATVPEQAIFPGEFTDLNFNLPGFYPPETNAMVSPIEDPLLFVEYAFVEGDQLWVGIFTDPMHGSGKIYLDIIIETPFEDPYHFWGIHYININPVPPVMFECPFVAVQFGNHLMVNWEDYHTYPFMNPLSARLVVDGNESFVVKPTGDFFIPVEPGYHTLGLFVDDYQVNSASYFSEVFVYDNTPPWEDGFEDYPPGSDIVGQGGWEFWFGAPSAPSAMVTNDIAHSGGNALGILGKPDMTGDDIVHQFTECNSGVWNLNFWQFIPEDAMQGATYITLLNQYGLAIEDCNWSTQVMFDAAGGIVESQFEGAQLPLIKGAWVPIEIRLDFDNDQQTIHYNGELLTAKSWTGGIPPEGIPQLAVLNLFSGDLTEYVYYDDFSLTTDDNFGLEDIDVFQVSYDWGESSQENSRVGLLSCKYTPQEQAMYLNAFTVDIGGEIYWLGQNYLPPAEYSSLVQKTAIQFDLLPLGIEPGMALESMPLWIVLDPAPLASIPDLPPIDSWPGQSVNILTDNTWGGVVNEVTSPGVSIDWPYHIDPVLFFGEIEELVYRGCNVPNIDLDDANHGDDATTGYAGDLNACVPAAYANSIEWLESVHKDADPNMDNNQNHREAMEDLSGEMNRDADSGTYYRNQLEGKMKYTQKHKLPIRTKFQCDSTLFGVGADVRPEGSNYSADNQTGATGKPDWDWFMNEMKDGEDVEMTVEWWDEANNKWDGGHCVAITGALQLSSGLRIVSFKHDRDQENADADSVLQEPSAVVEVDGWLTIPALSRPGFTARLTSFVSESYDETVTYDRASGTLEDPDGNPVDPTKVKIKARLWKNPDDSLSTSAGSIEYKVIDSVGFWDIDYGSFETPPQPGDRIVVTFWNGEKWVTKVFRIPEDGGPIYEDVTVEDLMQVHLDFTEWIQITIPPHQTLKVHWDSVTGCGNTDIVQWNGEDWYVPPYGHWNFNPTCTVKEISNDTDSPQYKRFHCDDPDGFYLDFSLVESTGVTTGSNQSEYATVNLGGMDSSNEEFGNINTEQYEFVYETNAQLGDFPGTIGDGGVNKLAVNFEAFDNPYWEDMQLTIDIAEVWQDGYLEIQLDENPNRALVPIPHGIPTVTVNIGPVLPAGIHTLTLTANSNVIFDIDCFNMTTVIPLQDAYDFGDCPDDPYPTLLANDGARHTVDNLTYLGALVDAEADGQPNATATGDDISNLADEDGITFGPIMPGSPAQITVDPTINPDPDKVGFLQGWMDFNNDGDWDDAGEQIFMDEVLHFSSPECLLYNVPANAQTGNVYARFRLSTVPGLQYTGSAPDGEVEDYIVEIVQDEGYKWMQEPCPELPGLHAHDLVIPPDFYDEIFKADDWLCNGGVVKELQWWGNYENGLIGSGINHFKLKIHVNDQENCLPVQPEVWSMDVPVSQTSETNTGMVNSENDIIYKYNYTLDMPFEQIEGNTYWLSITAHNNNPDNAAQWRWQESDRSTAAILCPAADAGPPLQWATIIWTGIQPYRYSDMAFAIISMGEGQEMDFGDAPDDPYPTLLANNGARHIIDGITFLGDQIDAEPDGQPNLSATGDDLTNLDDEDGVVFRTPLVAGAAATIKVKASVDGKLNVWLDVNRNGSWGDAGDHVFVNYSLAAGWNTLTLNVPANANVGFSCMRFRFNQQGGLDYYGLADNGEVEDYRVRVFPEGWSFIPTPVTHTIQVPLNVLLTSTSLSAQDAIGVWYEDDDGNLVCGGADIWDGASDRVVQAYGNDNTTPEKDGFNDGDMLVWKIHHASSGTDEYVSVEYDATMPQSDGKFTSYGLSKLTEMIGLSATATADPASVCAGDLVQLDVDVEGGSGNYTYSWSSNPPGFSSSIKNPTDTPGQDITYHVDVTDGATTVSSSVDVAVQQPPTADAGPDDTVCAGESYQLNGLVANSNNYYWDTDGDGTFDDATEPDAVYTPGTLDEQSGSVQLTLTAEAIDPCDTDEVSSMILTILETQTVELFDGWNGLSSYLSPYNQNNNYDLFDPVVSNMVVVYNFAGAFWPSQGNNTLTWDEESGVVIKMTNDDEMVFCGDDLSSLIVNLEEDWNIVPVLCDGDADITSVFDVGVDVRLVLEVAGWKVYWPEYNINTIVNLEVGKSYFAFMNSDDVIDFSNASAKSGRTVNPLVALETPWNEVLQSPGGHIVAFSEPACKGFAQGDIIGAFTGTGLCAGITGFEGLSAGIVLKGDDPYTWQTDGFIYDETVRYQLFRPSSGESFELQVEYDPELDNSGRYHNFSMSAIAAVKMTPTGIYDPAGADIRIYPNPSHGIFNVEGISGQTGITVFDAFGNEVFNAMVNEKTRIDLSLQPKGVYLVKVRTLNGTHYQKVVIN